MVACIEEDDVTKPWKEYVARPEPYFGWEDTGNSWKSHTGGTIHQLNVTSLQWLNSSVVEIVGAPGDPSVWHHEVLVIEPRVNKHRNTVMLYATGGCNSRGPVSHNDKEVIALDLAAFET